MKAIINGVVYSVAFLFLFMSCDLSGPPKGADQEMVGMLAGIAKKNYSYSNPFCSEARIAYFNDALIKAASLQDSATLEYSMGTAFLELGNEEKAIEVGEKLLQKLRNYGRPGPIHAALKTLAIAYLRLGERTNCVNNHAVASCIFPIAGNGIQADARGSSKAIALYEEILKNDPGDLESRWLLNVAYMAIGKYPQYVPADLLIKGLDINTSPGIKPFIDLAVNTGLSINNMAGGSIAEDFNNDGYLDLVTSSWGLTQGMHYCRNNGNGSFTDFSDSSGLKQFTGGLNMVQTDYNNDGLKDIFVLRGAWMKNFGNQPNSLLKNNGDGTFSDVTKESGLLSFHPTQTATWADFNNDGWLDVFIGNESGGGNPHPCELYVNNGNGTFTEVARAAGCDIIHYVKGVTSGDFNNDDRMDIYISTLDKRKILLQNISDDKGAIRFKDVSRRSGVSKNYTGTFSTWFYDYDNDGWLDILTTAYDFEVSLAWYAAQEGLGLPTRTSGKVFLFHNNKDGTFEEVSEKVGLSKVVYAMGGNFGDFDNDGFLDMYFGTGNPLYQSLVPNKMFHNINGERFTDITSAARVGSLQKGHGVSFADFDNDGDEDIYIEMGGAYSGDPYQNSLFINPGQNDNHWLNISLEGTRANRAAIGAKVKVTFAENGRLRAVYREVNSGGSFGANPLVQHIGIGQALVVKSIEIKWPGSKTVQQFNNVMANQHIAIREGSDAVTSIRLNKSDFTYGGKLGVGCAPPLSN